MEYVRGKYVRHHIQQLSGDAENIIVAGAADAPESSVELRDVPEEVWVSSGGVPWSSLWGSPEEYREARDSSGNAPEGSGKLRRSSAGAPGELRETSGGTSESFARVSGEPRNATEKLQRTPDEPGKVSEKHRRALEELR